MATTPTTHRPRRLAALALATTLALAGCGAGTGSDAEQPAARPAPSTTAPTATTAPAPATTAAPAPAPTAPDVATPTGPLTVRADHELAVHADPADAEPSRILPARNEFGSALALLVTEVGTGARDGWFEVLLPGRPNGGTGWVRAAEVTAHEVTHEVRVDLATRTLTVTAGDEVVLSTPVAIGEPRNPTPTGTFSLTDKLETGDPDGAYGPYALGLSGRSDVITEFAGGDGQVGIHGTDDPSSIGRAASHGCIRVPNDVAGALSELLSLGTPVTIA